MISSHWFALLALSGGGSLCPNTAALPALRRNEGRGVSSLDGTALIRTDAIDKCYQAAFSLGHNVFGLQNGECFSIADVVPNGDYARYGTASICPSDGRGASLINHVYQINGAANYTAPDYSTLPYTSLGCWKDSTTRAMTLLEGDTSLNGTSYFVRSDAINKCAAAAIARNLTVFGVQDGGQCWGALDNVPGGDYARQGNSSYCPRDGEGNVFVNHVYQIKNAPQASSFPVPYVSLGCWKDAAFSGSNANRALRTNEQPSVAIGAAGATFVGTAFNNTLDGWPAFRADAINKCYQVALQQGHNVFALQMGGWCYSQLDIVPGGSYAQFGNSSSCPTDGRGGSNINHVYQITNAPLASRDYTNLPYTSLGCWNDARFGGSDANRALRTNEPPSFAIGAAGGTFVGTAFTSTLDGWPALRTDAINKCYQVALQQGHNVFALQMGGWCYSQLDIVPSGSYAQYGNTSYCPNDGKGGFNINNIYQIKNAPLASRDYTNLPYTSFGCWNDVRVGGSDANRALRTNEQPSVAIGAGGATFVGTAFTNILDGWPALRTDPINKCYQVALQQGHNVFALQMGGWCYSHLDFVPSGSYAQFGNTSYCPNDGKGGFNINNVYQIKDATVTLSDFTNLPYTTLGCWNDVAFASNHANRALRTNEQPSVAIGAGGATFVGTAFNNTLDGWPALRTDAINKCYQVALQQGHNVFALQMGGWCYSQLDVVPSGSYSQYGVAATCPIDGKGGFNINNVYQIKNISSVFFDWSQLPYASLGCYKDALPRFLRSNEGLFSVLNGPAFNRTDAINKCYQVALQQGHNVFALQQNGQCFSGFDIIPGGDYVRYGVSVFCPLDGRGGSSINHVYRILSIPSKILTFADLPYPSGLPFYSLGCWADSSPKALTIQEGTDAILDGSYTSRENAIYKCYQVAVKRGHNVFGLQNDGQCYSKFDTVPGGSYAKYGRSTSCSSNGKGAVNANNVYRIV